MAAVTQYPRGSALCHLHISRSGRRGRPQVPKLESPQPCCFTRHSLVLQTTGGRARLLLSHFQTQVQASCLSHIENMPDAHKWCWGKGTADPLISGQGLASGLKPIIVIYRTICKEGGRKELLFTSFIVWGFFSIRCSAKRKIHILIDTKMCNFSIFVYPYFNKKLEIKPASIFHQNIVRKYSKII